MGKKFNVVGGGKTKQKQQKSQEQIIVDEYFTTARSYYDAIKLKTISEDDKRKKCLTDAPNTEDSNLSLLFNDKLAKLMNFDNGCTAVTYKIDNVPQFALFNKLKALDAQKKVDQNKGDNTQDLMNAITGYARTYMDGKATQENKEEARNKIYLVGVRAMRDALKDKGNDIEKDEKLRSLYKLSQQEELSTKYIEQIISAEIEGDSKETVNKCKAFINNVDNFLKDQEFEDNIGILKNVEHDLARRPNDDTFHTPHPDVQANEWLIEKGVLDDKRSYIGLNMPPCIQCYISIKVSDELSSKGVAKTRPTSGEAFPHWEPAKKHKNAHEYSKKEIQEMQCTTDVFKSVMQEINERQKAISFERLNNIIQEKTKESQQVLHKENPIKKGKEQEGKEQKNQQQQIKKKKDEKEINTLEGMIVNNNAQKKGDKSNQAQQIAAKKEQRRKHKEVLETKQEKKKKKEKQKEEEEAILKKKEKARRKEEKKAETKRIHHELVEQAKQAKNKHRNYNAQKTPKSQTEQSSSSLLGNIPLKDQRQLQEIALAMESHGSSDGSKVEKPNSPPSTPRSRKSSTHQKHKGFKASLNT